MLELTSQPPYTVTDDITISPYSVDLCHFKPVKAKAITLTNVTVTNKKHGTVNIGDVSLTNTLGSADTYSDIYVYNSDDYMVQSDYTDDLYLNAFNSELTGSLGGTCKNSPLKPPLTITFDSALYE